jgi:hypothetical protein
VSLKIFKYKFSSDETSLGLEIFFLVTDSEQLEWFLWYNKINKPYCKERLHNGQNCKANQEQKDDCIYNFDRIIKPPLYAEQNTILRVQTMTLRIIYSVLQILFFLFFSRSSSNNNTATTKQQQQQQQNENEKTVKKTGEE